MDTHAPLMVTAEVADRLKVSTKTVRRLVAAGSLPAIRVGYSLRFDLADVDAYIEQARTAPTEASA